MIYQFKVSNFLSIREEQTLDFSASSDKMYDEFLVVHKRNADILKMGVLYGPNASGKSNMLKALTWLIGFMASDQPRKLATGTGLIPFMMDEESRSRRSSFSLIFYADDARYEYKVELDSTRIYHEEMMYYPTTRKALFFERTWNEEKGNSTISFGNLLKLTSTQRLFIESNCVQNQSVLSTYITSNVEKNAAFDQVRSYLTAKVLPMMDASLNLSELANAAIKQSAENKDFVQKMLKIADFNITDFSLKENPVSGDEKKEELFFTHKTPYYTGDLSNSVESAGTMRMYGLSSLLHSLVNENKILLCDELENSLHYDLFTHIIKTFLANSENGQLIFTTHNLLLLNETYIRRDMVYLSEKNESGATEVFRAKDFGLHKDISMMNAYRQGKLGAVPFMGSIFLDMN